MRNGWKLGTLGDLVEEATSDAVAKPSEHGLLTVRLHAKGVVPSGKYPNETAGGRKHYVRQPGEILVGRQNYHRRCAGRVPDDLQGFVTSNAISAFTPKHGVHPDFALHAMQSAEAAEAAELFMSGTGQKEISVTNLLKVPFIIPPLTDQKRIVDLVASVDKAISEASGYAAALRNSHFEVLADMYEGAEAQSVATESLLSHTIGGAWGEAPGKAPCRTNALGPSAFAGGATSVDPTLGTERSLAENRKMSRELKAGDILLERSGGSPTQPVGRVIRALEDLPGTVPSDFMRLLRIDPALADPEFVFWVLWLRYRRGDALAFQKQTTNIRNLNIGEYLDTDMRLPFDRAFQRLFVETAEVLAQATVEADLADTSLSRLRAELLSVLLSGEHEIPESYDIDAAKQLEPAA